MQKRHHILWGVFMALAWTGVLLIFLKTHGHLSATDLLQFQPENKALAILMMTGLFLMKSVDFLLHSGVLYAVIGVMFPLPAAIALNILETVVMITPTYYIGKTLGKPIISYIGDKYSKIRVLAELPEKSELTVALLLRAVGAPATVASLYMGATGFRYSSYLIGSVCGMLPLVIAFTVMGTGVRDLSSPVFWIALACEGVVSVTALLLSANIMKKEKNKREDEP